MSDDSPRYDWFRFDAQIKERALALSCVDLIHAERPELIGSARADSLRIRCPSPSHEDHHPSCSVRHDSWRCFGCDAGGDVLDLLGVLRELPGFKEQLRAALELQGLDYEQERARFVDAQRRQHRWTPSPPARPTSVAPARAPHLEGDLAEDTTPIEARDPEAPAIWASLLDGLTLDGQAASYLARRGIDASLARAHGLVSARYEQWSAQVEAARDRWGEGALSRAGVLGRGGRAHPYLEHMLLLPYPDEDGLRGVRFRRLSEDETYGGVRYLSLRHGVNQPDHLWGADSRGLPWGVRARGRVLWVVEGELDALSLRGTGRAGLASPGAQAWRAGWARHWHTMRHVVIVRDRQAPGDRASDIFEQSVREDVLTHLGAGWLARHVHTCTVGVRGCKDLNDLLREGLLEGWLEQLEDILELTPAR